MVDFLLELAKVTEKTVSREELYKDETRTPRLSRRSTLSAIAAAVSALLPARIVDMDA